MSKKEEIRKLGKKEEPMVKIKEEPIELIDFDKAIKYFKKEFPEKGIYMEDKDALKLFVIKFLPELIASKKEFFNILKKY